MEGYKNKEKYYHLLSSWAKSPFLKGKDILITGSCFKDVYPEIFENFSKDKVTLIHCPEIEQPIFGKLASMIRSTKPASITVLTVDCSPHCYTLHAAVNEAFYILGLKKGEILKHHYVVRDGEIIKICEETIRVARYLSLVEKLIKKHPEIINELKAFSLEQNQWNGEK